MSTPMLAPPEVEPTIGHQASPATESLARPFRLGLVGLGAAIGLVMRMLAANNLFGLDVQSQTLLLGAAITSAVTGAGLLLMAAERDRFGPPLAWISVITALAWGALNWISPPFAESVTVWSRTDQSVLAVVGVGNGLLLAGIAALAFVRRHPTFTVATTLISAVLVLAANTVMLRNEWAAIVLIGIAFALILIAWDRSPRRELAFNRPADSPRVSRAVLSFVSVALAGTAIQLWSSRTDIPRSIPAVVVCGALIIGAFASLVRVRREIEQRETTLSEWTSWVREVRTNDFRSEMQNFEPDDPTPVSFDGPPMVGADGEAPRTLSFPGLEFADPDSLGAAIEPVSPDTPTAIPPLVLATPDASPVAELFLPPEPQVISPSTDPVADTQPPSEPEPVATAAPVAQAGGAFSALLEPEPVVAAAVAPGSQVADLSALAIWLNWPTAASREKPLLVAIEAMSLDEFESLPPADAAMATGEIGSFLADTMPDADLVSWIDGPYFIVAHTSKSDADLSQLNKDLLKSLKATDGTLALVRPSADADLDDVVNECVMGLLHARRAKDHAAGR